VSLFFDRLTTHARIQFLRHVRSPAIWILALAAPIAARFLVPEPDATYAILAVNNAYLALDPAVIGLQLGVIMAVLLSPLAYIFLRAGPTRRQPWQAGDLTPVTRSAQMLGHWIADTGALWILMLVLALAGVVLSLFRLPVSEVNPFVTILSLCMIAGPAMAVIAGLRTIFSTRRGLRGAGGDVLFFFAWMALIVMSTVYFQISGTSAIWDVFGFAAPIAQATDVEIETFVIGGSVATNGTLQVNAWKGLLSGDFLLTRLFWIFITACLVVLMGRLYGTHKFKPDWKAGQKPASGPVSFEMLSIPAARATFSAMPLLISEAKLALRPRLLLPALIAVALAGAVLPFRGVIGPALALLLIFPLTRHGARWRGSEMAKLSAVTPFGARDVLLRLVSAICVAGLLCIPAMVRMIMTGNAAQFADILAIAIGLPIVAILLGHLTRSAVAGRLSLLILWYGYLNL